MNCKNKKTKHRAVKIILLIFLTLLLLVIALAALIGGTLFVRYQQAAYAYQEPVERSDTYVMPEYPDISFESESAVTETSAVPTEELTPPDTAPLPESTAQTTTAPSPSTETPPVTMAPVTTSPLETLPPMITPPTDTSTTPVYTQNYDPNASFSSSSNAISVYGRVPIYKVAQKDPNVLNILVLGTDSRDVTLERGRSDTMLIVSYNKEKGSIKMVSLLRDSLVPIDGHDWNRINTAYAFGGVGLAVNTVNQLYDLDIQNFVVVDLNGALNFIDYIGGVDVPLTEAEAKLYNLYTNGSLSAGVCHLDGNLAMTHMRNRSSDNDFGRTRRQRDVITAVFRKIITEKSPVEIYSIVNYALGLVKTNISASSLLSLSSSVLAQSSSLTLESQSVPYNDAYQFAWYNGMAIISFDIADAGCRINRFLYSSGN